MYYYLKEGYRDLYQQCDYYFVRVNKMHPMYINKEAFKILKLCNGVNNLEQISYEMSELFQTPLSDASEFVGSFINQCFETHILEMSKNRLADPVEVNEFGSELYWTPHYVCIELTYACSLYCKHCYADAGTGALMNSDLVRDLVDDIINLGITTVQLTGGEPTLHPLFEDIVKKLIKNDVKVTVTTNGYFDINIINYFLPLVNTAGYVQISIDGLNDYHNVIRGKQDAYEKLMKSIEMLVALGVKVRVGTCLINQSEEDILLLAKTIKKMGVNWFVVSLLDDSGRSNSNKLESSFNVTSAKKLISKIKNIFEDENFIIGMEDLCEINEEALFQNCGSGYNAISINPLGVVSDCILSKSIIGSIGESVGFKKLLIDKVDIMLKNSQAKSPSIKKCGSCEKLSYCEGCIVRANEMKCEKYR